MGGRLAPIWGLCGQARGALLRPSEKVLLQPLPECFHPHEVPSPALSQRPPPRRGEQLFAVAPWWQRDWVGRA